MNVMNDHDITRREALAKISAGGVGVVTLSTGVVSARDHDRYIVGTTGRRGTRAARRGADSIYRQLDFGSRGQAVVGRFSTKVLERLRNRRDVRYIEVDGTMHAIEQTLPWGIDKVEAEKAHANGETGGDDEGSDIAIIDTGIDSDHPDLQANIGEGEAFVGCRGGPQTCRFAWDDDHNHGTHCAGIADSSDNDIGVVGVSTEATLHAIKVLDNSGSGSFSDVAAGITYVADQGWDVGSMSLGGGKSAAVEDAVEYAYDKGVLLVAAAGNNGPCSDCVSYPAAEPEVIAVSATSEDDSLASFSSTGPDVELAAPGEDIYSTVIGGYSTFSGTSMACPHVSGAGGQLMDNGYTNTEARDRLNSTATDIGLGDNEQGNGLLDVEAALGSAELRVDSLSVEEVETSTSNAEFDVTWSVSDPEGELASVDLVLQDTTDGEEEDTETIDVSGDTANDTTSLVASGDEGSGNSYEVTATVTDGDGNTASKTVSTAETESVPTVDSLSLSEVEADDTDEDAIFDADWAVSDDDGDLDTVDLVMWELDTNGTRVEEETSVTESIAGDSARGTTRLVAVGDDGEGKTYEVDAVITDTDGDTGTDTATITETESTSSAPVIDQFDLTDTSNPHWARVEVDWGVSDVDNDLSAVMSEAIFANGGTDTKTSTISGDSVTGEHEHREVSGHGDVDVTLTVTDNEGNSTTDTKTITLD